MVEGKDIAEMQDAELKDGMLINESALKWSEQDAESIIGEKLDGTSYIVLGVLKDFHFSSTKNPIAPIMVRHDPGEFFSLGLKYRNGEQAQVLAHLNSVWESFGFAEPPNYQIVEHFFAESLERENLLVRIFDVLTIALIVISALGLFAMAVLESQQKQKEMSIRKVLGANNLSLLQRLNQRFLWLIFIAIIISVPITQLLIDGWLDAFPYRIDSTYGFFALSAGLVLLLAIVMLTVQGIMRLRQSPADVLRNE